MKSQGNKPHPGYLHHKDSQFLDNAREIIFGMQDGMVSTLGAITGIAIGSGDKFVILLAGMAIISVESISMGIGSYTSARSEKKLIERMLDEECEEVTNHREHEKTELYEMYVHDGWSEEMAQKMVEEAGKSRNLMYREMAYRELHVSPELTETPAINGVFMFAAYIIGGLIPLMGYIFLDVNVAIYVSIIITLIGLFALGSSISRFTNEKWYQTGAHMFVFGGIALLVGYLVGLFSHNLPI